MLLQDIDTMPLFNILHLHCSVNSSKNHRVSRDDALKYGTAIFIITISSGISVLHYFYFSSYFGTRVRVAVTSLIYRKVFAVFII